MSTSSAHGETVRVELREVEDVADEPLEPPRLGLDHLERQRPLPGSSTTPSSSAATWPRIAVSGVRSSCETDMRKFRSRTSVSARRAVIWSKRSARCADLAGARARGPRRRSCRSRPRRRRARSASTGCMIRRERYQTAPRDEQAAEERDRKPRRTSVTPLAELRLRLRDEIAPKVVSADPRPGPDSEEGPVLPGGVNSNVTAPSAASGSSGSPVERVVEPRRPERCAGERAMRAGDVVEAVAGRLLEARGERRRRARRGVRRVDGVELRDPGRLAPELGDASGRAQSPGRADRDRRRDEAGERRSRRGRGPAAGSGATRARAAALPRPWPAASAAWRATL